MMQMKPETREKIYKKITLQATKEDMDRVVHKVATTSKFSVDELRGRGRGHMLCLARSMAISEISNLGVPLAKIGEYFGGRDHTTILNAIKRIEKEIKKHEGRNAD